MSLPVVDKQAVISAFAKAVPGYPQQAVVQRQIARQLASQAFRVGLPDRCRILEIGCGTGFLSELLRQGYPAATLVCSDLVPEMVRHCRQGMRGSAATRFVVMDGEQPAVAAGFDLVVSSLALQWFHDAAAALVRWIELLRPGGVVLFATLGADTFREWRSACHQAAVPCGVIPLPSRAQLSSTHVGLVVTEEAQRLRYPSAQQFLREIKSIGANTPAAQYRPITPSRLRRLLRDFDDSQQGLEITYHILYGYYYKPIG
ncbi:MAG: methyltransferase domain-containing protein [Magnetococcales bacterium]|nr:methyltransferase domain-containing protein [Magnetococcales bacterium]